MTNLRLSDVMVAIHLVLLLVLVGGTGAMFLGYVPLRPLVITVPVYVAMMGAELAAFAYLKWRGDDA